MIYSKKRILRALVYRVARLFSDRSFLEILFPLRTDYPLDLDHPKTFNEKLQWLKLYDHRPEYPLMVDKVEAKKYVSAIIGENYIIPTIAVYNSTDEIDFNSLPHQFVLKCTHDSGSVIVCKDKEALNRQKALRKLNRRLKYNYFYHNREWPYKEVKPRIIAELYLDNDGKELRDYKIYCFHGEPLYCQVVSGRKTRKAMDFFDKDWNHQPFHKTKEYPFATEPIERPVNYSLMFDLARRVSANIPFLRVDFYEIKEKVYFGELTFFPASGMGGFEPMEWDYKFGDLIRLPNQS